MAKTFRLSAVVAASLICGSAGAVYAQDTKQADKKFIEEATGGSLIEINLAKLALQKSQDKNVREFAEKMIKDHTKLIQDMKPLAAKLGAKIPSSAPVMGHVRYDELKLKSGTGFDRGYVEDMVKDHHEDLKEFKEEEGKTTNAELKAAVVKGEAVIREHTEMIDKIARMGGIETPAMP